MRNRILMLALALVVALSTLAGTATRASASMFGPIVWNSKGHRVKVHFTTGATHYLYQGQKSTKYSGDPTGVKVLADYRCIEVLLQGSSYVHKWKVRPSDHWLLLNHNSHVRSIEFLAYPGVCNKNSAWGGNFLD